MNFGVSWLPLVIGTVFNMGLGALWYSNVLFAKPWMRESSVTEEQIGDTSNMGPVYGLTMVFALITSYVIGFVVGNFGIGSIGNALLLAIFLWIGLDLPMVIKNWGFEGRTILLGLINHGYQLVVYAVVAVLYALL